MTVYQVLGELLLGWLIADAIGGIVHYLEDEVLPENTPGLRSAIAAQRLHHREPGAFLKGSLWTRNWSTWLAAGAVSLVWLSLLGPSVTWGAATAGGMLASMVHAWAHSPATAPRLVRILQETGFLQSPKHHGLHHKPPHNVRWCPLTNYLNPLVDAFRALFIKETSA